MDPRYADTESADVKRLQRRRPPRKGALLSALLALLGPLASGGCSAGDRPEFLALATAGTGGVYYLLGGSIAEVWSRELPDRVAVAEVTGGSVENLSLLMSGQVEVAFSMGTNALEAYDAAGDFTGRSAGDVLALVALYPNVLQVATLEGSGVATLSDLAGRRVSVGAPGSGTEVAARTLLEANGISYEDFEPQRLNFNETANAIRDGTVDAGFWSAGPPTSSIMDLATVREIRLLDLADAEVERTAAVDPTVSRDIIPSGAYRGMGEDVATLSTPNILVVGADMPEELAYALARTVLEAQAELAGAHPVGSQISAEYTLAASPIPLHPGAARYFRENGHDIPDRLLPVP